MALHLQRDMDRLKRDIVAMGSMVEETIRLAVKVLQEQKTDYIDELRIKSAAVDQREVEIEEDCLKMLALHQPVAADLRFIAAVVKINNDLERMDDLAVNVAQRGMGAKPCAPLPCAELISAMVNATIAMVHRSLDALVQCDATMAREVCAADETVDELNRQVIQALIAMMHKDPSTIDCGMHLFSASRHLERIADHATNIAEDVVYMVEGEIIRHAGS